MNSNALDLDIHNYTPNDLMNFFKLTPINTTFQDVKYVANKMINSLSQNPTNTQNNKDIIHFIKKAEKVLELVLENNVKNSDKSGLEEELVSFNDSNNLQNTNYNLLTNKITETNPNFLKPFDNIGKIINPNSTAHQSLQKASIPSNSVNPYNGGTIITNYVFNTQFRDNFFFTSSENCTFTLPTKIKNVISMSLSAIQIPNVMLPFFKNGTDSIYIVEDNTGLQGVITIPSGYYTIDDFPAVLESAINTQLGISPNRFTVSIDPNTYFTTIANTTNTFRMNLLRGKPSYLDEPCSIAQYYNNVNVDDVETKNGLNIKVSQFVTTMGYLIGYRKPEYAHSNSYTSESMFNNIYTDYVYFCLDEYAGSSQYIANYGVLPNSLINDNILAVVPITTPKFISTFADNSDFIFKTRNYNGPIDIQKISVKILNPQGVQVFLHSFDYGFNLQITSIYDNIKNVPLSFTNIST